MMMVDKLTEFTTILSVSAITVNGNKHFITIC